MRVGSLFSGIGGIDLGFEQAGHETVFQVEIDEACRAVLERHFLNAKRFDDVQTVGKANLPACDVLVGGFPCQDLSVAGRRKGLAGERSGLFHEFMRIAYELSPAWVLIENVPGLLSSNDGRDMGVVIGTLAELGYGVGWRVLDSQYFGLAQRRKRVFIVGSLGTHHGCTLLLEPESCDRDLAPSRETGQRVAYPVAAGAGGSKFGSGRDCQDDFIVNGRQDPISSEMSQPLETDGHSQVVMMRWREGKEGGGKGELLSPESAIDLATANDQVAFLNDPAPTLRGFGHGWQGQHNDDVSKVGMVRRLTPTECERLQGFPDGWTFGSDSTRYRQLGNAVSVPVARWIAERLPA